MRIAAMILSLVLMFGVGFQSCTLAVGSEVSGDKATSAVGGAGIFVTVLFLIGGAFVLGKPDVSVVAFALAAALAFGAGTGQGIGPLFGWGVIALGLAILSFFGRRELRKTAQPEIDRAEKGPTGVHACQRCATPNPVTSGFCRQCGAALPLMRATPAASTISPPARPLE